MTDEAIEDTLEKVVKLLAYISDKDLFAEFYRKKLARRLLHDRSSSDEHERSILSRLKQQCGAQFTSKVMNFSHPSWSALCCTAVLPFLVCNTTVHLISGVIHASMTPSRTSYLVSIVRVDEVVVVVTRTCSWHQCFYAWCLQQYKSTMSTTMTMSCNTRARSFPGYSGGCFSCYGVRSKTKESIEIADQCWLGLQMEGMVTDLQLARDKQQGFEDWKRENAADKPLAMDLQVTVLTTGFWPSYKVCIAA